MHETMQQHDAEASKVIFWTPTPKKVLYTVLVLNVLMTAAQYFAALLSGSLAILTDAAHMTIDIVTYVMNIYVETLSQKKSEKHRVQQIQSIGGFLSGGALLGAVVWLTISAIQRLANLDDSDEVDIEVVLGFSCAGLFVDLLCMYLFYTVRHSYVNANAESHHHPHHHHLPGVGEAHNMNMCGAAVHAVSDLVRSIAVIAVALIAIVGDFDATTLDARCTLFLGALIGAGAAWIMYASFPGFKSALCGDKKMTKLSDDDAESDGIDSKDPSALSQVEI